MLFLAAVAEIGFILFWVWLCDMALIIEFWSGDRWNIESVILLLLGAVVIGLSIHFGVITVGIGE